MPDEFETEGAVTADVCGAAAPLAGCERVLEQLGSSACLAPQNCGLLALAPPNRRVGILAGTMQVHQFATLLRGPVSQQRTTAGGDALTLEKLLVGFVVKVEFSCPCPSSDLCGCRRC